MRNGEMNSLMIRLSKTTAMAKPVRNQADVHLWQCPGCLGQLGGIILIEHALPNVAGLARDTVAPDSVLDRAAASLEEIEGEWTDCATRPDPDDSVRHAAQRYLREPWATE